MILNEKYAPSTRFSNVRGTRARHPNFAAYLFQTRVHSQKLQLLRIQLMEIMRLRFRDGHKSQGARKVMMFFYFFSYFSFIRMRFFASDGACPTHCRIQSLYFVHTDLVLAFFAMLPSRWSMVQIIAKQPK